MQRHVACHNNASNSVQGWMKNGWMSGATTASIVACPWGVKCAFGEGTTFDWAKSRTWHLPTEY